MLRPVGFILLKGIGSLTGFLQGDRVRPSLCISKS